jgi:predicted acyltransferase
LAGKQKNIDLAPIKPKSQRLSSLDALRGFDMFWIVSGEGIVHGLASVVKAKYHLVQNKTDYQIAINNHLSGWERFIVGASNQLHHSVWNGFSFYDLIFPLFIFIAGVSMPFSFKKHLEHQNLTGQKGKKEIYIGLIRRTILLILLGMVVNGDLHFASYADTRFASVLGRIALSLLFAAIIYLNTNFKSRLIWLVGILLGYWAMMTLIAVPGFGRGNLTPEGNLAAWFDRLFLPGKLHRTIYDPEGWLSTIPAVGSALLGVFTGELLNKKGISKNLKALWILLGGLTLVLLGSIWNTVFPINKNMWTSSFVLYAGGWSLILLALFYYVIDVLGFKRWSMPLVWLGCNSILIYMAAHGIIDFKSSAYFIFGGLLHFISSPYHDAFIWSGVAVIQFVLLWYLYKKKIFLKL